jgi:hypothetical protein
MDNKSTHEYVQDLHEKQRKDKENKARQSQGRQSLALPNKQH